MKYNNNFLVAQLLVEILVKLGLKHVCLSPGSRNTPLTLAFAGEKRIEKKVFVDERSSAFFALGLAKSTGSPVAVVCTSGTAAAELYPAIVEAYTAQVPLIVITADRPEYLKNTGSNQTINQTNIYAANCDYFFDPGVPETSLFYLQNIVEIGKKAFNFSLYPVRGPVHINLPFEKPLEPLSWNCEVSESELNSLHSLINSNQLNISAGNNGDPNPIIDLVLNPDSKIVIILANKHYRPEVFDKCIQLSHERKIPVCVEAALDISDSIKSKFIHNLGNMLQSTKFKEEFNPDTIIIFGRNPISKTLERYLNSCRVNLISVNPKGEYFGKVAENKTIIKMDENFFLDSLLLQDTNSFPCSTEFYNKLQKFDEIYRQQLGYLIKRDNLDSEVAAMATIATKISSRPELPVFISNSLPIRDFDFLKQFFINPVYSSRGASGIDGIIATAAGISTGSKSPTILVIGDLSFHYDSNTLHILKKYQIPLLIILMNNNGGSIFEYLPVYSDDEDFKTYFKSGTDIDFGSLIKAYGIEYKNVESAVDLGSCINQFIVHPTQMVIELNFDSVSSKSIKDVLKSEIIQSFENIIFN